jgi:tRNA(Ile)-lysidine synthase
VKNSPKRSVPVGISFGGKIMLKKVKATIEKYNLINKDDKIVIGVSGGPDSICLLHVLYTLGYNICVAHINHGLRENAVIEEKYVQDFCNKLNIPIYIKRVVLKDILNGMTTEEAGRRVRYEFFDEVFRNENCTKIATAHTANDKAETIVMNILRGSGITGLKGIEACRGNIVRPLIEVSREEIELYCKENNLEPKHDESNDETIYTRNKVRLELIPYIKENINPNIIQSLNRMSDIISEEEKFIQTESDKLFDECIMKIENNRLICDLKKFNMYDIVFKRRLIIKFIIKVIGNAKDIEKVHIDDIVKLCGNNVGGKFLTPNKNIKVSINRGKIIFEAI